MYSGWISPFKHKSIIQLDEKDRELKKDAKFHASDERLCLIRFNSTFIEMIDRRYRLRGMVATLFAVICIFILGVFWLYLAERLVSLGGRGGDKYFVVLGFLTILNFAAAYFCWWLLPGRDFFTYTHYPIRFNRKSRMVHAFVHNGPGGVISVPWDKAFFHIGKADGEETYLRDLRCHVVDESGSIVHTFAVGHYYDQEDIIRGIYEFIRRYMEEGPAAVVDDPGQRRIDLSTATTWRNCFYTVVASLPMSWFSLRYVLFPLYGPLVLCRWLVFKTCKAPVWPPEVEAESAIEAGDPHQWREPQYQVAWADDR